MEITALNEHNKQEYPPMHTCEHVVNRTMVNLMGCGRAVSAHIERKKSKKTVHYHQVSKLYPIFATLFASKGCRNNSVGRVTHS